jgi:hypothetical protein
MVEQNKDLGIIASEISSNLKKLISTLPSGERLSSIEYNHDQAEWIAASSRWNEEEMSPLSMLNYLRPEGEPLAPSGAWVTVGRATGASIGEAIKNLVEDRAK